MYHPQLEIFVLVADSGSFSKAAEQRFCSPVSIMNQINSLEDRIGVQLLSRSTQGVSLTAAGQSFYADAKKIMAASEKAINRALNIAKSVPATIRLGTSFLRPCKPLLERLEEIRTSWQASFNIKIVTFDDEPDEFLRLQEKLGQEIDCFVSPCDSSSWRKKLGIFQLGFCRCCIALPKSHPLASKTLLSWEDMAEETIMLVQRGISPVIDAIRDEIEKYHPEISIMDAPNYYDIEVFNKCEQAGYIMEVPEIWTGVHPSLITLPVEWEYVLPYGVVYSSQPSQIFTKFLDILKSMNNDWLFKRQ